MRLLPRSLVGRVTLWVVAVTVVALVVSLISWDRFWLQPLRAAAIDAMAGRITATRALLEASPAALRPVVLDTLSKHGNRLSASPPAALRTPSMARFAPPPPTDLLRERAGNEVDIAFAGDADQPQLVTSFLAAGERYWLAQDLEPITQAIPRTLAFGLAVLATVAVLAAGLGTREIARPLRRIADDIARSKTFGTTRLDPLTAPRRASREISEVVDRYNELVNAVGTAHDARQQLLAGVSHDLKTPLARARLRAETTLPAPIADAIVEDLAAVERVVTQFVAYVHLEQAPALGRPVPVEPSVEAVVRRYQADTDDVSARIEATGLALPALAIDRLLMNLIDNALAYGAAPIEVELRRSARGGDTVELIVADRGLGLDEASFERAQRPFVRLDDSRGQLGHCGLGLTIVRQIVDRLRGHLSIRRGRDHRFEVVVSLPAGTTDAAPLSAPALAAPAQSLGIAG